MFESLDAYESSRERNTSINIHTHIGYESTCSENTPPLSYIRERGRHMDFPYTGWGNTPRCWGDIVPSWRGRELLSTLSKSESSS